MQENDEKNLRQEEVETEEETDQVNTKQRKEQRR